MSADAKPPVVLRKKEVKVFDRGAELAGVLEAQVSDTEATIFVQMAGNPLPGAPHSLATAQNNQRLPLYDIRAADGRRWYVRARIVPC